MRESCMESRSSRQNDPKLDARRLFSDPFPARSAVLGAAPAGPHDAAAPPLPRPGCGLELGQRAARPGARRQGRGGRVAGRASCRQGLQGLLHVRRLAPRFSPSGTARPLQQAGRGCQVPGNLAFRN